MARPTFQACCSAILLVRMLPSQYRTGQEKTFEALVLKIYLPLQQLIKQAFETTALQTTNVYMNKQRTAYMIETCV